MNNKQGDLRVWHIPQIPGKPFYVAVASVPEAKLVLGALADYDLFQLKNNIKPDYANAQGLEVYESISPGSNPQWCEWCDEESGNDIGEYQVAKGRKK